MKKKFINPKDERVDIRTDVGKSGLHDWKFLGKGETIELDDEYWDQAKRKGLGEVIEKEPEEKPAAEEYEIGTKTVETKKLKKKKK